MGGLVSGCSAFLGSFRTVAAMPVSEVKTPDHRARCISCTLRFGDDNLPGPTVDLGAFEDGPVEDLGNLRTFEHAVALICGGCLRKAAALLPEFSEQQNTLTLRAARAERARDEAVALAAEQARIVADRLDLVAPPKALEDMTKDEVRVELKKLGVEVGPGNHSRDKLIEMVRGATS